MIGSSPPMSCAQRQTSPQGQQRTWKSMSSSVSEERDLGRVNACGSGRGKRSEQTIEANLNVLWTDDLSQQGLLVLVQLQSSELDLGRRLESSEGSLALCRRLAALGRAGRGLLNELVRGPCETMTIKSQQSRCAGNLSRRQSRTECEELGSRTARRSVWWAQRSDMRTTRAKRTDVAR